MPMITLSELFNRIGPHLDAISKDAMLLETQSYDYFGPANVSVSRADLAEARRERDQYRALALQLDAEISKLRTALSPPTPKPPAFPLTQHDQGPWRR